MLAVSLSGERPRRPPVRASRGHEMIDTSRDRHDLERLPPAVDDKVGADRRSSS